MKISITPPENSTCHLPSGLINAITVAHDSFCAQDVSVVGAWSSARSQRGFASTSHNVSGLSPNCHLFVPLLSRNCHLIVTWLHVTAR